MLLTGCGTSKTTYGDTNKTADTKAETAQKETNTKEEISAPKDEKIIVGFSNYMSISYFMDMGAAAHKAAKEAGAEFYELRHNADSSVQQSQIEDLVARGAKVLITEVCDDTSMVKTFAELKKKGIVIVNCDIYTEGGDFWIASDNKQIGRTSAEEAVRYLTEKYGEPKGTIVILSSKTTTSMIGRAEGFREVIEKYPNIEIVDEKFPTDFDAPSMMALTDDILQVYGKNKLDIIFASNQTQLEGANAAIITAGRQDVALFGVDDSDAIFDALQDPKSSMQSTVVQDPIAMGKKAVEVGIAMYKGEKFDPPVFNPEVYLVTRDNVKEFIESKKAAVEELKDYYGK